MSRSTYTAFAGFSRIATGDLRTVLSGVMAHKQNAEETILIFDHLTGRQVDFDLRGSIDEVISRVAPEEAAKRASSDAHKPGKGRPRLGVVSAEVTLLPRHWEWLAAQPLKASGTLRRLVDEARAKDAANPRKRIEALGNVLWSLAGNLPNFEEATRSLYASDTVKFAACTEQWPEDLRTFAREWLAAVGFPEGK